MTYTKDQITAFMNIAQALATVHHELVEHDYFPFAYEASNIMEYVKEDLDKYEGPSKDLFMQSYEMCLDATQKAMVRIDNGEVFGANADHPE